MRAIAATAAFAVAASTTGAAFAQAPRLSDIEFIKAARCAGLAGSEALGGGDAASFEALLKTQKRHREAFIRDRADSARKDAVRAAGQADPSEKAALIAERDGICATFLG